MGRIRPPGGSGGATMKAWTIRLLRWIVGAVFLWAGAAKWGDSTAVVTAVQSLLPVPFFAGHIVAIVLPPLECLTGLMLLTGIQSRNGSFSAVILSTVFFLVVAQAVIRGIDVSCACFGGGSTAPLWQALIRNVFLLAACVAIHRANLQKSHNPACRGLSALAKQEPAQIDQLSQPT